jgi:hypothetical protein
MNKTKLVPFDIEKAKHGAKIVTRDGHSVRIGLYDIKYKNLNFPIMGVVQEGLYETPYGFTKNGKFNEDEDHPYDLFIEEEVKERLMTYEEVALWLTEMPHRQYKIFRGSCISTNFSYNEESKDEEATDILIREDKGEWHRPTITE